MIKTRTRLDRFLASALSLSKQQTKLLLAQQSVLVDQILCTDGGQIIDRFSEITVAGQSLSARTPIYWMLHKPRGVVSATLDATYPTVIDCIEHPQKAELHLVGRLDILSTGLVLLTNDGRFSRALTAPKNAIEKHYAVTLSHPIEDHYIQDFADGMYFAYEDLHTAPATLIPQSKTSAIVILQEGRYHHIKRLFGRYQNEVLSLHRFRIGSLLLDPTLAPGQSRALTQEELTALTSSFQDNV